MPRFFRKHEETDKQIRERLLSLCKKGDYGTCPAPMDAIVAINELKDYFLGKDWSVSTSVGHEQVIAEIVFQIETKCRRFRATE